MCSSSPLFAAAFLVLAAASGCSKRTAPENVDTVPPQSVPSAPAKATDAAALTTIGGVPAGEHQVEHGKPGTPQDPSASEQRLLTGEVVVPPGASPGAGGLTATPALDQKIAKAERGKDKKAIAAAYLSLIHI